MHRQPIDREESLWHEFNRQMDEIEASSKDSISKDEFNFILKELLKSLGRLKASSAAEEALSMFCEKVYRHKGWSK